MRMAYVFYCIIGRNKLHYYRTSNNISCIVYCSTAYIVRCNYFRTNYKGEDGQGLIYKAKTKKVGKGTNKGDYCELDILAYSLHLVKCKSSNDGYPRLLSPLDHDYTYCKCYCCSTQGETQKLIKKDVHLSQCS